MTATTNQTARFFTDRVISFFARSIQRARRQIDSLEDANSGRHALPPALLIDDIWSAYRRGAWNGSRVAGAMVQRLSDLSLQCGEDRSAIDIFAARFRDLECPPIDLADSLDDAFGDLARWSLGDEYSGMRLYVDCAREVLEWYDGH